MRNWIEGLRKNKAILQKDLADGIGVSKQTISAWETNQRVPDSKNRKKLCDFFGLVSFPECLPTMPDDKRKALLSLCQK